MTHEPGSYIDEELADRHSDLLFSVSTEVGDALVYLLFEHQSTLDPRMPFRMLRYMVRIWERFDKQRPHGPLPVIIPLLICHAPGGWTSPRHFHELFAGNLGELPGIVQFVPDFTLIVDDLAHVSDDDLKARTLAAFPKLALWLLRDARHADRVMAGVATWAEKLTEAEQAPNGMAALLVLFRYILEVNEGLPWEDFQGKIREVAPAAEPAVMTVADQLMNKGRVGLLTKLLALKFGELTEHWRVRLAAASVNELEVWAERVLTATTIDQVFAD
jgi:hypothetical protein